ncbi:hypothetical protein EMPS_09693 [Entomortierella parvispora]|uniref:Metal homeostatis protein bsd2 n=1 Tax=Entomortierella parvispora TaxID=205924 RepID=A0A9P3M0I1_9FUNG|nr:hypothetical protein EMPS_09693 [Entomortierella parvispora]
MPHSYSKVQDADSTEDTQRNSGSTAAILNYTANMQEHAPLSSAWTEFELAIGEIEEEDNESQEVKRLQGGASRIELQCERSNTTILNTSTHSLRSLEDSSSKNSIGRILNSVSVTLSSSGGSSSSSYSLVQSDADSEAECRAQSYNGSSSSQFPPAGLSSNPSSDRRMRLPPTTDGVFANLSAKPEVEGQKDNQQRPPAYDSAVQDITPPYFEMTVATPSVFGDEILVDGIPVGNIFQFAWNVVVAVSFQFLGVLLTYMLHNSHASKSGSMVGLGITLVNFGVQMRGGFGPMLGFSASESGAENSSAGEVTQINTEKPPAYVDDTGYIGGGGVEMRYGSNADSAEMDWLQTDMESHWVSMILILAGWTIIIRSMAQYVAAKRTEKVISALPMEERPGTVDRE